MRARRGSGTSRQGGERGAAAVEFALIFPILMMLVFGIISFGIIFAQSLSLSNAARQASRAAVIEGTTCQQVEQLARDSAATIGMQTSDIQVTVAVGTSAPNWSTAADLCDGDASLEPCAGEDPGANVYVRLDYDSRLIIPLVVVDSTFGITGNGVFRCELT